LLQRRHLTAGVARTTVLAVPPRFAVRGLHVAGGWSLVALCLAAACATPRSFYENDPTEPRSIDSPPTGFLGDPPPPSEGPSSPPPGLAAPAAAPPRPGLSEGSPWLTPDIPCSAGPQALLPALEARVLHRVRPPVGLVPLSVAGTRGAAGLQVKVVMEIDRRGTIRRSAVAASSGIGELDRAVLQAIDEAGCMPVPSQALLDQRSGTFKVSLGYLFGRS
jgi:TonB family protein